MDRETMVERAADAGSEVAAELFRTDLTVDTKASEVDYVTRADTRTQQRIVQTISEHFPDDTIVAEEGNERKQIPTSGVVWVVDPIDGTTNYVNGIQFWVTSVTVVEDDEPVAAANVLPILGDRYVAGTEGMRHNGGPGAVSGTDELSRSLVAPILRYGHQYRAQYGELLSALSPTIADFRRIGSAQASLSLVAAGAIEATVGTADPYPWDTVAGAHLVEQAGGTVTDIYGEAWSPRKRGIVASNGRVHDELLATIPDG
jgi:myo-inositol-1(or 4)-monophosphatase